ncbi:MAG: hypothetical protein AAF722_20130 [Cyanobacteria bacterium P01_C01_bin.70]
MDGAPDEWLTVEPPLASVFTAIAAHSARPILLRFCGGAGAARDGFPGTKSWGFLGLSSFMSLLKCPMLQQQAVQPLVSMVKLPQARYSSQGSEPTSADSSAV